MNAAFYSTAWKIMSCSIIADSMEYSIVKELIRESTGNNKFTFTMKSNEQRKY